MPRKCCVPGCTSNYSSEAEYTCAFSFPKNENRRKKWITAINRKDYLPTSSAVVCVKHFDDRFIIKKDEIPQKDGSVIFVDRKRFLLTEDAYPTIFPNQPHYLTKILPNKRKSPLERRNELSKRDDDNFFKFCEADQIKCFEDFKTAIKDKTPDPWVCNIQDDCIYIYKIEIFNCPEVTVVLKIFENLSVDVYFKNERITTNILSFILGEEHKLDKWTKYDSTLSFLNGFNPIEMSSDQKLCNITEMLNDIIDDCNSDNVDCGKLKFIVHQVSLSHSKKKRYASDILLWAAKLYFTYPSAYTMLRSSGVLSLPHQSYLRSLTSVVNLSDGNDYTTDHFKYLKHKITLLEDYEKTINILLDEIYIKPLMDYKGGNIVGIADNSSESVAARTVQTFMISSPFSKNKDVVALIPVKSLNSDQLLKYTYKVMDMLNSCGYTILTLISDNNRVNRNMFSDMCNGNLTSSIENPYDKSKKIFFLFDTPHLVKSLRNNWLNQKLTNQTFFYPDPSDFEKINVASLQHLKQIFDNEKGLTIKSAPKLTRKVLFLSSFERQNVNYAVALFHETNIVALEQNSSVYGKDFLQTKVFIEHIQHWWKIVNVKHPKKGRNLRDKYCDPITKVDHYNLQFLLHFYKWLCKWEELSCLSKADKTKLSLPAKGGMLSTETMFALKHTTKALIDVSSYLLLLKTPYVLLGKFQTDSLEACFGQYRQMSGGNYSISFRQILESDKKLKVLNLINIYSKRIGEFSIKCLQYSDDDFCEDDELVAIETQSLEEFRDVVNITDSINVPASTKSVLTFVAGYVALKAQNKISCNDCISTLLTNDELLCDIDPGLKEYTQLINRGGLKWPQQLTFDVVVTCYQIFQVLLSDDWESKFLKQKYQKHLVIKLAMEKIIVSNVVCVNMCPCGRSSDVLVKKCLSVIVNILLNNYCKGVNDNIKISNCKRKLSTLPDKSSK